MRGQSSSHPVTHAAVAITFLMAVALMAASCTTTRQVQTEQQTTIDIARLMAMLDVHDTLIWYHGQPIATPSIPMSQNMTQLPTSTSPDTIIHHRQATAQVAATDTTHAEACVMKTKETHVSHQHPVSDKSFWKYATIVIILILLVPAITQVFRRFF